MKKSFKNQKGNSAVATAEPTEAPKVAETPEPSEAVGASEEPEISETSESSETSEKSELSEKSENSELSETSATEEALREAERRGYLKGRNERIEQLMQVPFQAAVADDRKRREADSAANPSEREVSADELMILRRLRKSCWED